MLRDLSERTSSSTFAVSVTPSAAVGLADRICVLRRRKQIGVRRTAETDKDEIVAMITGLQAASS